MRWKIFQNWFWSKKLFQNWFWCENHQTNISSWKLFQNWFWVENHFNFFWGENDFKTYFNVKIPAYWFWGKNCFKNDFKVKKYVKTDLEMDIISCFDVWWKSFYFYTSTVETDFEDIFFENYLWCVSFLKIILCWKNLWCCEIWIDYYFNFIN